MTTASDLGAAPAGNLASYERYFASGQYDRRYPRPNPTVMRLLRPYLSPTAHVIDYGCGSGRYLLAVSERVAVAAGFDVCEAALDRLRNAGRRRGDRGVLHVLGPAPSALEAHVERHGPADLVLCLFGVLSHIDRAERGAVLRRIARLLKPGTGRLVLSVPNRRRRFRSEQRTQAASDGEVSYLRRIRGAALPLSYKLYDAETLRAELRAAGFEAATIAAESLVPESLLANSPLLRSIDRLATRVLPAELGYGLLAVARPEDGPR
jgi:tRNA (uracil-5-)-methyltransferase TRM9